MTYDLVVLAKSAPQPHDVAASIVAGGGELQVGPEPAGAPFQLCDEHERTLVLIEVPMYVQVPGEVERVLGDFGGGCVETPVWWLELHAAEANRPVKVAHAVADELAARLDGVVWVGQPSHSEMVSKG